MSAILSTNPPPFAVKRWTLDEYHRMIDSGALTDKDKVELLEGWIVPKMPRNQPHDEAVENTDYAIREVLPKGWRVRVQSAVTIYATESEPEPDIYVYLHGRKRRRHPEPSDMALVIEVSDTTLNQDRRVKSPVYARGGIPVYWIVNINDRQIEVYTEPDAEAEKPKYLRKRIYRNGDSVPVFIAGEEVGTVRAADLLPSA